ncbi:MAG: hypothetical protein J0I08_23610, partial [Rhizobiales bacterium]|nr:hypothetical protein [Hyphomicrobiales bacterium]
GRRDLRPGLRTAFPEDVIARPDKGETGRGKKSRQKKRLEAWAESCGRSFSSQSGSAIHNYGTVIRNHLASNDGYQIVNLSRISDP